MKRSLTFLAILCAIGFSQIACDPPVVKPRGAICVVSSDAKRLICTRLEAQQKLISSYLSAVQEIDLNFKLPACNDTYTEIPCVQPIEKSAQWFSLPPATFEDDQRYHKELIDWCNGNAK